jgi:hypothetical protein
MRTLTFPVVVFRRIRANLHIVYNNAYRKRSEAGSFRSRRDYRAQDRDRDRDKDRGWGRPRENDSACCERRQSLFFDKRRTTGVPLLKMGPECVNAGNRYSSE